MRAILRLVLLAILVPGVYVASAVVYFPAVVAHRYVSPHGSALMEIRARDARLEKRSLEIRYRWVPLERISPHLVRAVLAAEDTRFYEHHGFDVEQIREAWERNQRRGRRPLRGASTISQQTVKNLYLSPSRNVLRKAREAVLTAWAELWLPKDRILELYLNVIELGPGVFGAEAASRVYFGRPAEDLSRDQAALLAATLPAPLARNPDHMTRGLRRRQRLILSRMGRWYEGPSLAAEDAVRAEEPVEAGARVAPAPPETLAAEPVPLPVTPEPGEPVGEWPADGEPFVPPDTAPPSPVTEPEPPDTAGGTP